MVEEPQATTNLLKRGNELNFLPSSSPSPPIQGEETTEQQQQRQQQPKPTTVPVPVPEKSIDLNQHLNRKLLARQQSITRGTASSLAKAVRPNLNDTASTATTPTNTEAIIKRRLSAAARTRKQSLTATTQQPATIVENKQLLNVGTLPSNANGQRRSSWSPPHQSQIITTVVPELPSSPSPSPPPIRKVFEAKRRASMIPTNQIISETSNTTAAATSPPPNNNNNDSSIVITSNNNVNNKGNRRSSLLLLQKRPSKYSPVNMNTDDGNHHEKTDEANNNNAASSAGNHQQTPSFSLADASVGNEAPVASNAPDVIADEVSNNKQLIIYLNKKSTNISF